MFGNEGVQCRTMLSQRPCGSTQCTREECSRARISASVLATIPGTENDVTGPQSVPQSVGEGEPLRTLTGLSDEDLRTLAQALTALRKAAPVGMDYRHVDTLRAHVIDLWLMGN